MFALSCWGFLIVIAECKNQHQRLMQHLDEFGILSNIQLSHRKQVCADAISYDGEDIPVFYHEKGYLFTLHCFHRIIKFSNLRVGSLILGIYTSRGLTLLPSKFLFLFFLWIMILNYQLCRETSFKNFFLKDNCKKHVFNIHSPRILLPSSSESLLLHMSFQFHSNI